ncbi:hypothetical protein, partial [Caballeronia sp. GAOx1]|uniref:hypothetical protein n=1 Tax=Caballeronia sp. GAOx1 TaxID=2921761 RepID=UPI002027F962
NGAAQLGMEMRFRKLSDAVNSSKNLGKRGLERGKLYFNKGTNWVTDDEEYINAEHEESQPITLGKNGELIYPKEMDLPKLLS